MRLFEVVRPFDFDGGSFSGSDVVSFQGDRVPGGAFPGALLKGPEQDLLAVLLQISLPFKLYEFKSMGKLLVGLQEKRGFMLTAVDPERRNQSC